jgi:hypothetical protein
VRHAGGVRASRWCWSPLKGALQLSQFLLHAGRVLLGLLFVIGVTLPASAQSVSIAAVADTVVAKSLLAPAVAAASGIDESPRAGTAPRALTLPMLQVSFGALEIMDVVTTMRALDAGLTEANVAVRGVADRPIALASVKAGAAAATLILVNRMARKNRRAAIITMIAVNAAYSATVIQNARALRNR